MKTATGGLDGEAARRALDAAVAALAKQMVALEQASYDTHEVPAQCPGCSQKFKVQVAAPNATEVARSAAHTMKAADELYRPLQFAKGHPDSRPDHGMEWLTLLTHDELVELQRRAEAKTTGLGTLPRGALGGGQLVADLLGDDLLSGYTQISTDLLEALGRMLEAVRGSRWMRRPRLKSCASTCGTSPRLVRFAETFERLPLDPGMNSADEVRRLATRRARAAMLRRQAKRSIRTSRRDGLRGKYRLACSR